MSSNGNANAQIVSQSTNGAKKKPVIPGAKKSNISSDAGVWNIVVDANTGKNVFVPDEGYAWDAKLNKCVLPQK